QKDQQPTIKIGTSLVSVPVIVTDRFGRFTPGLNRNNFSVLEDGAAQRIEDFSASEAPFNVALLIDTSHSTQAVLGAIRKAALSFIKQLYPRDRVMIVTFDEKVHFISDFSGSPPELEKAIKSLKSGYLTSLYDAIYLTITEKMSRVEGRKAIVILTDGIDTFSKKATYESALDLVASTGIITYAIQYETRNMGGPVMNPILLPPGRLRFAPQSFIGQEPNQQYPAGSSPSTRVNSQEKRPLRDRNLIATEFLRAIAVQSGGLPLHAENIENTAFAFKRIADELRNMYTITYISSNEARDGKYRTIKVNLNGSDLIARYRLGYRAPLVETDAPETKAINPPKQ
ncbi:MAG: VWA domain-containing protein, partial [Blastocatellia bacterium]|nr:VWA domain-containing protein [Blastocatellia bacterium]